ncbi:MAG: Ldh family oxidoreductase [Pirellulales bacterium]
MPTLSCDQLTSLVTAIFEHAGAPPAHARLVANHLVEANTFGHDSHGVLRVPQYCMAIDSGELVPHAKPSVVRESAAGAVMDGRQSFGQVAVADAMNRAIDKASNNGIGAVTIRNCYHSGRLGAYSALAADAGMIGMVMVNAGGGGQSVVPFGGSARRLATNPFSIAAPTNGDFPLVLDIATSMAPEGKVRDHALRGVQLPEGWIVDAAGRPSCNPEDFYGPPAGSLLPLGGPAGHKGFGLALMIDVLAGALSGAGCCRDEVLPARDGVLLIAIHVDQFSDRVDFDQQVRGLIDYVKSCPPAPGFAGVFVPGEIEHREAQQRRRVGIALDDNIWQQIQSIAEERGITCIVDPATNGHPMPMHTSPVAARRDDLVGRRL